jgi:FkbM family methyltransferase
VEAIFRRFASGRTLIDCGANIGYWSVRAKELGFKDAIAIEANGDLIPFLKRNYRGAVHHAAVHSRSGETLYLEGQGATASLAATGRPVRTLALADLDVTGPVLIKLDVEGAEIAAIEGAAGMDAIFVYEDWPRSGMLVTRYVLEKGYSVFGFDMQPIRTHAEAFDFNRRTRETYGPSNLLAMRGSDPARSETSAQMRR